MHCSAEDSEVGLVDDEDVWERVPGGGPRSGPGTVRGREDAIAEKSLWKINGQAIEDVSTGLFLGTAAPGGLWDGGRSRLDNRSRPAHLTVDFDLTDESDNRRESTSSRQLSV
jgi:hypothetical protein